MAHDRDQLGMTHPGIIFEINLNDNNKELTSSSEARGDWLQTTSFTEIQTGNATPRSIITPFTFFVYSFEVWASITAVPN